MATDQVIQLLQERFADIAFAPAPLVDTPKGENRPDLRAHSAQTGWSR